MSNRKYLVIDNYEELSAIEAGYPELRSAPIILLSDSFNLEQLAQFKRRGYCYYDDAISDEQAKMMSDVVHKLLWSWYKDPVGNDISSLNGLSFGKTFCGSIEPLICAIIKHEVGLSLLIKPGDELYYSANTDEIFLRTVAALSNKNRWLLTPLKVSRRSKVVLYGKRKIKIDRGSRVRDISTYFKVRLRDAIGYLLLQHIRKYLGPKNKQFQRVLFYYAAKSDEIIKQIRNRTSANAITWLLPLVSRRELLRKVMSFDLDSNYWFVATNKFKSKEIIAMIAKLEENINTVVKEINAATFIALMRENFFSYMPAMLSFYKNAMSEIQYLTPKLLIIGADTIEPQILIAQAAKRVGVATALLPHGIDCWGYKELRVGGDRIIDYCFAFGAKHAMDNLGHGVDRERIVISSFPYFSGFIGARHAKPGQYVKALLLTPDIANMSPGYKQEYFLFYLCSIARMLRNLGINISAIKARGDYLYHMHDLKENMLVIDGIDIPLLSGYTNFPDAAQEADLVIGNSSTAIIEAGLMGIDYYVIYPKSNNYAHSISRTIEKIMHVSFTVEELKDNIQNRRVYRDGYSVDSFVDLSGVVDKGVLYRQFEDSVCQVLKKEINHAL